MRDHLAETAPDAKRESGVYRLNIGGKERLVYCNMGDGGNGAVGGNDDGGWTVFQRRSQLGNREDYFLRDWGAYRDGLGDPAGEHWLGLEALHRLTLSGETELRVSLADYQNRTQSFLCRRFSVGSEPDLFKLGRGDCTNKPISTSMPSSGYKFSTYDREHDTNPQKHCAAEFSTGWWFASCPTSSNLNGLNLGKDNKLDYLGIIWSSLAGNKQSLRSAQMELRRKKGT